MILSLIRAGTATTRRDLQEAAELGRAVVDERLATLERLRLIAPGETGAPSGGRAPLHFRFCAEAGDFLIAHVGAASIAVAMADLNGQLISEHHEAIEADLDWEALLERLTTLFLWMLEELGGRSRVWGVALALPEAALIEVERGRSETGEPSRYSEWEADLALTFGAPCILRGSTQMMALGELVAGAGCGVKDMLCVRMDGSISAGLVCDGRVHRGAQDLAGLIGHAPTGESGDVCACGARGCLDAAASGEAVARVASAAARDGRSRYLADMLDRRGEIGADDVASGAQLGDPFCAELLARSGRLVGEAIAPLVNLANPAAVVLGGALAHSGEVLLAAVREAIYRRAHPIATQKLRISRSELGGSAELIGAARAASDEVFAVAKAREWIAHGTPRESPVLRANLQQATLARRAARSRRTQVSAALSRRTAIGERAKV